MDRLRIGLALGTPLLPFTFGDKKKRGDFLSRLKTTCRKDQIIVETIHNYGALHRQGLPQDNRSREQKIQLLL